MSIIFLADLSQCELMQIPDAVYHLMRNTELQSCNLSGNVLKKVAPKFALKFSAITGKIPWNIFIQCMYYISPCSFADLNLSHNQLSKLPDEFTNLSALNNLNISHNSFIVLPQVVFKLPKLSTLDAQHNAILGELCRGRCCCRNHIHKAFLFTLTFQRSTPMMPSAATAWLWWIYAIIPSADIVVENWKTLKPASVWRSQVRSMMIGRE